MTFAEAAEACPDGGWIKRPCLPEERENDAHDFWYCIPDAVMHLTEEDRKSTLWEVAFDEK